MAVSKSFKAAVESEFEMLRRLNEEGPKSLAYEAVLVASQRAIFAVLEKHNRRGDSWEETFSLSTCINLAGAKLKRVEILLDGMGDGRIGLDECGEEMVEEAGDAMAYISFGLWKLERL